jgi:uncharacterized protein YdeI (YjbR/CyaY-like superfamily)
MTAEKQKPELEVKGFATPAAFERWLKGQHAKSPGIWLQIMKKGSGKASVTYAEALDVALCWGWIDGQIKTYDADSFIRKFVPRGPRSVWSKINRGKVQALIEAKRMQPAGLAHVERARADGRWDAAYDSPRNAKPPADFAAALSKSAKASKAFAALNGANRYAVLYRVQAPKKAETRERKIRELIAMLERGEAIHG